MVDGPYSRATPQDADATRTATQRTEIVFIDSRVADHAGPDRRPARTARREHAHRGGGDRRAARRPGPDRRRAGRTPRHRRAAHRLAWRRRRAAAGQRLVDRPAWARAPRCCALGHGALTADADILLYACECRCRRMAGRVLLSHARAADHGRRGREHRCHRIGSARRRLGARGPDRADRGPGRDRARRTEPLGRVCSPSPPAARRRRRPRWAPPR